MKEGSPQTIRNVIVASSHGVGKTSLCEALAYAAGAIPSLGSIPKGNTVGDFEPEEISRQHSISSSIFHFEWQGVRFNLIDTPGTFDFSGDTRSAFYAADGVILVLDANAGVRTELQRVWDRAQELELPCVLMINQLDKERTDFDTAMRECEKSLELKGVPITIPLGAECQLSGVIDLYSRKNDFPSTQ